jgi:hypothetical protein
MRSRLNRTAFLYQVPLAPHDRARLLRFETIYQFVARDKDGRLWRRWPTIVTPTSVTPRSLKSP